MVNRGHVPQRMCAGCGKRFAKAALVRFTVRETAVGRELVLAAGGNMQGVPGRGGYVCPDPECLDRALARKSLLRRLKTTGESPGLREEFARLIEARQ